MRACRYTSLWNVKQKLLIGTFALLLASIIAVGFATEATPSDNAVPQVKTDVESVTTSMASTSSVTPAPSVTSAPSVVLQQGTIKRGQTVFELLRQVGVSAAEVATLRRDIASVYDIRRVRVGQPYGIEATSEGRLDRFVYEIDAQHRLEAERQGAAFVGRLVPIAYEYKERMIQGVIHESLYEALASQGESPKIAADLVDIFSWEVDFHTDVRVGDTFRMLIEERYRDNKLVGYHRILAAELSPRGQDVQAVYYPPEKDDGAYYHPDGRSLRRMFLRSPLRYTRISSRFSHRRFHPVLNRYRPHLGIDYAAPIGTPVRSVADGAVVLAGRKGKSGKMIKVRHNHVYSTYYLHLSRFARGIKAGRRVTQGQVIGYVGSTGLSTGPHLDFRITKNGKYLNPLRYKSIEVPPLSREALPAFQSYAEQLLAKLEHSGGSSQQVVVREQ